LKQADGAERILLPWLTCDVSGASDYDGTEGPILCSASSRLTLDELVPADHFYRHFERTLDLSFVCELVRAAYVPAGRPSIDPVVFFRLQLVQFFEGLRSERQLLQVVANRLSRRKSAASSQRASY
jgi:transposase